MVQLTLLFHFILRQEIIVEPPGDLMERKMSRWGHGEDFLWSSFHFFKFLLALSKADKMKPDWTLNNKGSCKGTALWLILCSFNKLSAKGHVFVQSKAASIVSISPLLLLLCVSQLCLVTCSNHRYTWRTQTHVETQRNCMLIIFAVSLAVLFRV